MSFISLNYKHVFFIIETGDWKFIIINVNLRLIFSLYDVDHIRLFAIDYETYYNQFYANTISRQTHKFNYIFVNWGRHHPHYKFNTPKTNKTKLIIN